MGGRLREGVRPSGPPGVAVRVRERPVDSTGRSTQGLAATMMNHTLAVRNAANMTSKMRRQDLEGVGSGAAGRWAGGGGGWKGENRHVTVHVCCYRVVHSPGGILAPVSCPRCTCSYSVLCLVHLSMKVSDLPSRHFVCVYLCMLCVYVCARAWMCMYVHLPQVTESMCKYLQPLTLRWHKHDCFLQGRGEMEVTPCTEYTSLGKGRPWTAQ